MNGQTITSESSKWAMPPWVISTAVAIGYFLLAKLGFFLAFPGSNASPIWPAAGFALFSYAVCGLPALVGIFAAAVSVNFTTFFINTDIPGWLGLFLSVMNGLGNALEAWFTVYLLKQWNTSVSQLFEQARSGFLFIVSAALGCSVASSVGSLLLIITDPNAIDNISTIWVTWFLGDLVGILTLVPFFVSFTFRSSKHLNRFQSWEFVVMVSLFLLLCGVLFLNWTKSNIPTALIYWSFPFFLWSSFRFSTLESYTLLMINVTTVLFATLVGLGPFSSYELNFSMLLVQSYIGLFAITLIMLTAIVTERFQSQQQLESMIEGLDQQVANKTQVLTETVTELTASLQQHRLLFEHTPEAIIVFDPDSGHFVQANPVAIELFGLDIHHLDSLTPFDITPKEQGNHQLSSELIRQKLQAALEGDETPFEWIFYDKDKQEITCKVQLAIYPNPEKVLIIGSISNISHLRLADELFDQERKTLESIAARSPLEFILRRISRIIRVNLPHSNNIIYLADRTESNLTPVEGSMPITDLPEQMSDVEINAQAICPGMACAERVPKVSPNVFTNPTWKPFYELAKAMNVKACWSYPIINDKEQLQGALTITFSDAQTPSEKQRLFIEKIISLISIAISSDRAEQALILSEQKFRTLYEDSPSMLFTLTEDGFIIFANAFSLELLRLTRKNLIGRHYSQLCHPDSKSNNEKYLRLCATNKDSIVRWESCLLSSTGEEIHIRNTARALKNNQDEYEILVSSEDITETLTLSKQLQFQASHDNLTGLLNRREIEHRITRVVDQCRTYHSEHALCFIDLDHFKAINDACGHSAGDELLKQLSQLLSNQIRQRDTLARMGGDEFGLLLEHCSEVTASKVAEQVLKVIKEFKFIWKQHSFQIGASIGIVTINSETATSTSDIINLADKACYTAKETGRSRIYLHKPQEKELTRNYTDLRWINKIRKAIDEDTLVLYKQTIKSIEEQEGKELTDENRGDHFEILVRYPDEKELHTPESFMAAIERHNLTHYLDQWVVSKTFEWLAASRERIDNLHLCSINLSGNSLSNPDFIKFLRSQVDLRAVPHEKICFEITETSAIQNLSTTHHLLKELQDKGYKFALDDFGSGLSSFGYLKSLPVDYIKIDGLFVKDIEKDPLDLAMVKAINEMAHVMGKPTIAEFVENEVICQAMIELKIDFLQGHFIGKPEPIEF